jgi:hypothetical protein
MQTSDATVLAAIMARIEARPTVELGFEKWTFESTRTENQSIRTAWPSGNITAPINIINDPWADKRQSDRKGGGYRYVMAERDAITGQGKHGDAQMQGHEGIHVLRYHEGYINLVRQAILEKIGDFNDQLEGAWAKELATSCGKDLHTWLKRWQASYGIGEALCLGYSHHVNSLGTDTGDLGVAQRHHPNLLVCGLPYGTGDGYCYTTWSSTTADFEAALAKNVIRSVDSDACKCNAANLRFVASEARRKAFTPINGDAENPLYLCFLHEDSWNQLLGDNQFLTALQKWAGNDDSKTWKTNQGVTFAGLLIFHGFHGPCEIFPYYSGTPTVAGTGDSLSSYAATSATAVKIAYGPVTDSAGLPRKDVLNGVNVESDTCTDAIGGRRLNWILGGNAITAVQTTAPSLARNEWDYGAKAGICIKWMGGFNRKDMYDAQTAASATVVTNQSSLPFVTFSPRQSVTL